jgi:hypothetical protein
MRLSILPEQDVNVYTLMLPMLDIERPRHLLLSTFQKKISRPDVDPNSKEDD